MLQWHWDIDELKKWTKYYSVSSIRILGPWHWCRNTLRYVTHQSHLSPLSCVPFHNSDYFVTNVLVQYWYWWCHLVLIYWFLPFIVPDLCECLPTNLKLTGFDAGCCHIYYATDCFRHTSAIYINLQTLLPLLHHTINWADIYMSTTATEATWHYWSDLFFHDARLVQ